MTDLDGNIYRYDEVMYCGNNGLLSSEGEVEYFINKQYENFTGVLYFPLSAKAFYDRDRVKSRFDVYCDDNLIYTSPEIDDLNAGPYSFEINTKGSKILKIRIRGFKN